MVPIVVEQVSVLESGDRSLEDVNVRQMSSERPVSTLTFKNSDEMDEWLVLCQEVSRQIEKIHISTPRIKNSTGDYDWQNMFQKEWPKAFLEIQRVFCVFGGFRLAQPPITGFKLEEREVYLDGRTLVPRWLIEQSDIPLQKRYRHFQMADLKFLNGALVKLVLKAHFDNKYSEASVDREYKALQNDVVENLKCLNKPDLGICFGVWPIQEGYWVVIYGLSPNSSVNNIPGLILTSCKLRKDANGYDLTLSVDAYDCASGYSSCNGLRRFIEAVVEKDVYEAGEEIDGSDKKQQSGDSYQSSNQARKSDERKAEDAGFRSTGTATTIPSPTISEQNGEETSTHQPDESTEPQPQIAARPNPHFEAAKKHDWQSMCQKEWNKSFAEIQKIFSVFGGFQLAQPPIDGVEFDSEDIQKDVPLRKQYRYFQKADLEFAHGALVGFTLKAHFAKTYSKASVERECKSFQDDVVKNLKCLKRPELGIGLGSTFPYHPWHVEYGESRLSAHKIVGMIITSYLLRQSEDGYDLTLSVDANRGLRNLIELMVKKEADETGDDLEDFNKKQRVKVGDSSKDDTGQSSAARTSKPVRITGFGSYKFGQKYLATRMTAEMWQEGSLAIKPVQVRFRKFKTLELGYAIDGKQLCRMKFCAEFPSNADDKLLSNELSGLKGELERQFGFEMSENGNEINYEDDNYVVKAWYQAATKTVYNTKHVGFRKQRVANTVNVKGLYLMLEDKRLMPK